MMLFRCCLLLILSVTSYAVQSADAFIFDTRSERGEIFLNTDSKLLSWAADDVAGDLSVRTGIPFTVGTLHTTASAGKQINIIVEVDSENIHIRQRKSEHDIWESFAIYKKNGMLHVTGADERGAVYGLFTLAEKLGISPWQWWADVPLKESKKSLRIEGLPIVDGPAVKYRGIFLNDEDWGLLPWATNTFEPEEQNIGPATYEKVFQLLLRLKANTLWPAMHPGTRAFFKSPANQAMAKHYQINIGSSHAEPMLRNNVDEWDHEEYGDFNYVTNQQAVDEYWSERVRQVSDMAELSLFTLGMRGVHDSGMEGIKNDEDARAILQNIIDRQRAMLASVFERPASTLKQVFTPYKEVLKLYELGLDVPDDVTVVWPDDNYGYIRKLSNEDEQMRSGGAGVYYHLSYWGRPHDYLWLSSTHPALIKFEMHRAYANGARELWVANVGDIKPLEYNMEWFLHLGWEGPEKAAVQDYLQYQLTRDFGEENSEQLARVMLDYYHLAFKRRPEFMGWSQTEPTTETQLLPWSERKIGQRLDAYNNLQSRIEKLRENTAEGAASAFFELIEYPVAASAEMNRKWLYRNLASVTTDPVKSATLLQKSHLAYENIQHLTGRFNSLENGKWSLMMDASPRRLPVFDKPELLDSSQLTDSPEAKPRTLRLTSMNAPDGFNWQQAPELGYSRGAMSVYPLKHRQFGAQEASLTFGFDTGESASHELFIATLPVHANDYGHKLTITVDGALAGIIALNTRGRSEEWKQGVLANRIVSAIQLEALKPGFHTVTIGINQTGIVIDDVWLEDEQTD